MKTKFSILRKKTPVGFIVWAIVLTCNSAAAEPFFSDGFESADINSRQNGFEWLYPSWVDIVRDDQYRVYDTSGSIEDGPYAGRQWENAPGSDGRHSMRFHYTPTREMSEQRFSMGGAYPELWIGFSIRVPINFAYGPTGSPNKLLAIWMDGYSQTGDGSTVWLGFHPSGNGNASFSVTHSRGRFTGSRSYQGSTEFIDAVRDRGRWMQLVVHLKAGSSDDAYDGSIGVWRRWENEAAFTKTHSYDNWILRLPSSGPQGFSAGYLFGWANALYEENTEFLLDDFVLSRTSLLQTGPSPTPPRDLR